MLNSAAQLIEERKRSPHSNSINRIYTNKCGKYSKLLTTVNVIRRQNVILPSSSNSVCNSSHHTFAGAARIKENHTHRGDTCTCLRTVVALLTVAIWLLQGTSKKLTSALHLAIQPFHCICSAKLSKKPTQNSLASQYCEYLLIKKRGKELVKKRFSICTPLVIFLRFSATT